MEYQPDETSAVDPALTNAQAAAAEVAYARGEITQTRLVTQAEAVEAGISSVGNESLDTVPGRGQTAPILHVDEFSHLEAPKPSVGPALLNLIHRKVFMGLRQLPPKPRPFEYDSQRMTLEEVKAAAAEAGLPFGNCRPVLILREVMRRTGMQLAF